MSETRAPDGGPAFPMPASASAYDGRPNYSHGPVAGMSLRDYFAAHAMQNWTCGVTTEEAAAICYAQADAMLATRKDAP